MVSKRLQMVEAQARRVMDELLTGDLGLAHNYEHVNRVRHWAVKIARQQGYADLAMVQTAALLHDIGLAYVTERRFHAEVGAEKTAQFLATHHLFPDGEIAVICEAIRCHTKLQGAVCSARFCEMLILWICWGQGGLCELVLRCTSCRNITPSRLRAKRGE